MFVIVLYLIPIPAKYFQVIAKCRISERGDLLILLKNRDYVIFVIWMLKTSASLFWNVRFALKGIKSLVIWAKSIMHSHSFTTTTKNNNMYFFSAHVYLSIIMCITFVSCILSTLYFYIIYSLSYAYVLVLCGCNLISYMYLAYRINKHQIKTRCNWELTGIRTIFKFMTEVQHWTTQV